MAMHNPGTASTGQEDGRNIDLMAMFSSVCVIIPVAGYSENLQRQLLSICLQKPACKSIICVTEDNDDSAVPVITMLRSLDSRVVHVCAGKSTSCSQKNHNLLAGFHHVDGTCDFLVFCDAGHLAPANWLYNLLSPLLHDPSITVSSGYHQVYPRQSSMAVYCRAVCVTALHLLRRIPPLSQPWGGATAIRVADFCSMNVAGSWSGTIVDDVVLAALLKKQGKKLVTPVDADTRTYIDALSFTATSRWLTRQIAYLKFIFPKTWLLLGFTLFLQAAAMSSALLVIALSLFVILPAKAVIFCSCYLLCSVLCYFLLRLYHPDPGSAACWYGACLLCSFLPFWCFVQTALSRQIYWGDRVYTVEQHGNVCRVEKITRRGVRQS